jgi:hypothetical protein
MFQGFLGRNITYGFTLGSLPSPQYFTHDEKRECQHRFFLIQPSTFWGFESTRNSEIFEKHFSSQGSTHTVVETV